MMPKIFLLSKRNIKHFLTDPLSLIFCIALPIIVFCVTKAIIPTSNHDIIWKTGVFASGISCFSYSLFMLFAGLNIVEDKKNSFFYRIKIAPISYWTYLFSFIISMLPFALGETIIIFLLGFAFGLPLAAANFILAIIYLLFSFFLFLSIGIFLGTTCSNAIQVTCFSIIFIAVTCIFGGIFMPLEPFGDVMINICNYLPFIHCARIASELYSDNNLTCIYPHIIPILVYSIVFWGIIVAIYFGKKVKKR